MYLNNLFLFPVENESASGSIRSRSFHCMEIDIIKTKLIIPGLRYCDHCSFSLSDWIAFRMRVKAVLQQTDGWTQEMLHNLFHDTFLDLHLLVHKNLFVIIILSLFDALKVTNYALKHCFVSSYIHWSVLWLYFYKITTIEYNYNIIIICKCEWLSSQSHVMAREHIVFSYWCSLYNYNYYF